MPAGEVAGELLGGIFRLLGYLLIDIVFDVLVRGLGTLVCKLFSKRVNSDGFLVVLVGLFVWLVIIIVAVAVYGYVTKPIAADNITTN
ncbi:hypothetical protein QWI17_18985 [Gilvimarinus sp. SDUM040013]|uniref:Uncharacterized protein n=1 Tax=Gilvimarinus gilvus TaxID=3058038 RepID=A0ABU4RWR6_9GAMM|nr:hypothetical protein [Gilvimarinus sp. SDUM040013]MDO3387938.1 hypothetical protein [Gilvimarinus sp. SDUM040013]MDX6848691.1 hypothetical protein [Gilvimarinus sp. SDUM040013]